MKNPKQKIRVPIRVRINAKNALVDRQKFKDKPMTRSGVYTAKMLEDGFIYKDRIGKVYSFLKRTAANTMTPRRKVAFNGWGGLAMIDFIEQYRRENE